MKHLLSLLVATTTAYAETDFNTQLHRAKRTFERQSSTALLPEYEKYITELTALERALVSKEDFTAAIAVQTERLRIKDLIASSKAPLSAKRRPHTFKKEDALSSKNTLTWTPKTPIPPGGYKVTTKPEASKAIVSEGFHTALPGQTLRITTGKTITITLPSGANITQLTLTPGA